jgi:hypothetical protein
MPTLGLGSKDEQENMFRVFYKEEGSGNWLGLAIAKQMVD